MRTPAVWPLHKADGEGAPAPGTGRDAPRPLGPRQAHRTPEAGLKRPASAAQPSPSAPSQPSPIPPSQPSPSPPSEALPSPPSEALPSPPSLESILAATSLDEATDRQGPGWGRSAGVLIAGLATLGVLVPCLVGAAIVVQSTGLPPLALPLLGRTDKTDLPAPSAAPAISAAGANRVSSPETRAPVQVGAPAAPSRSQLPGSPTSSPLRMRPPRPPPRAAPPCLSPERPSRRQKRGGSSLITRRLRPSESPRCRLRRLSVLRPRPRRIRPKSPPFRLPRLSGLPPQPRQVLPQHRPVRKRPWTPTAPSRRWKTETPRRPQKRVG